VSVLYSDGSYGTEGFRAIQDELDAHNGFCTAVTLMLKSTFTDSDYEVNMNVPIWTRKMFSMFSMFGHQVLQSFSLQN
jgi:hypothetical protein